MNFMSGFQSGEDSGVGVAVQREHMFDKVVTPSDVGKLNRLVIPKQHAEKYFPLDSSANDKGLLLNFEDRNGKPWRFRYSYWNSSQSYVMTKGWSRFVKEKKLDAGDVVSFQRGLGEAAKDRLFIDWRRRPDAPELLPPPAPFHHRLYHAWSPLAAYGNPWPSVVYFRGGPQGLVQPPAGERMVFNSVPVVEGKATAKRLRLFGVNMECAISEEEDHRCDITMLSSSAASSAEAVSSCKGKGSMSLDLDI